MEIDREALLISRIVDRTARDEDWTEIDVSSANNASLHRRVVEALREDHWLRAAVRSTLPQSVVPLVGPENPASWTLPGPNHAAMKANASGRPDLRTRRLRRVAMAACALVFVHVAGILVGRGFVVARSGGSSEVAKIPPGDDSHANPTSPELVPDSPESTIRSLGNSNAEPGATPAGIPVLTTNVVLSQHRTEAGLEIVFVRGVLFRTVSKKLIAFAHDEHGRSRPRVVSAGNLAQVEEF